MRKPGTYVLLIIMVLSTFSIAAPGIVRPQGDPQPVVSGTRAGVVEETISYMSDDCTINGNLYYKPGSNRPLVIFGTGYVSLVTGQAIDLYNASNYSWLANPLADNGYAVLVLRYCPGFGNMTEFIQLMSDYTTWIRQTKDGITAMLEGTTDASVNTATLVDGTRIALGGHSIGGAVSIVAGATDKRVKCVFGLAAKDLAGSPQMDDYISALSPMPVQLQVGENDQVVGLQETRQSYNTANSPKQKVEIRHGTYEGFTDLGDVENIESSDIPGIGEYLAENPLKTRQHDISINYTLGLLDHYLMNKNSYDIFNDYSEGYSFPGFFPLPPRVFEDVWHASVEHMGLNQIFFGTSTIPSTYDYAVHDSIEIRANIAPKGIWEEGVEVMLTYPEGATESYPMTFYGPRWNGIDDTSGGYFTVEISDISNAHSLGMVTVNFTVTDDDGETYQASDSFMLSTSSGDPSITDIDWDPDPMEPGELITFTITATDPDQDPIAYYSMEVADHWESGWVTTNTITYTFEESGNYAIHFKVKDDKAAESLLHGETYQVSQQPSASLMVDTTVREGDLVKFDASGSSDPDGDDLEYFFVYGDGRDSSWVETPTTSIRYDSTGEMLVSVKVKDPYGRESDTFEVTINVKEKKDDSFLAPVTSSGGFSMVIILFIIVIIVAIFLFMRSGEEDEDEDEGEEDDEEVGDVPMRDMAKGRKPMGAAAGGTPGPKMAKDRDVRRAPEDRKSITEPQAAAQKKDTGPAPKPGITIDAPPIPQDTSEPQGGSGPDSAVKSRPPKSGDAPVASAPLPPPPPPPSEASTGPKIDAPPIKEESWDDDSTVGSGQDVGAGDDDDDDSRTGEDSGGEGTGDQDGDVFDDEDFAIPVALKDKLNRESE